MKYNKMSKILVILLYFNIILFDCCVVSLMMIYEKSKYVGDVMF